MRKARRINVIYKKLGRANAWGQAHLGNNLIEVDVTLKGKKLMEIMLHESTHVILPNADEEEVERDGEQGEQ